MTNYNFTQKICKAKTTPLYFLLIINNQYSFIYVIWRLVCLCVNVYLTYIIEQIMKRLFKWFLSESCISDIKVKCSWNVCVKLGDEMFMHQNVIVKMVYFKISLSIFAMIELIKLFQCTMYMSWFHIILLLFKPKMNSLNR